MTQPLLVWKVSNTALLCILIHLHNRAIQDEGSVVCLSLDQLFVLSLIVALALVVFVREFTLLLFLFFLVLVVGILVVI